MFITSNQCIPFKGTLGGNAVVSCYGGEFPRNTDFLLRSIWLTSVDKFDSTVVIK